MGRKLGDQQFKAGEYSKAINKYEKALRYLDQGGFAGEDKVQKRKKRKKEKLCATRTRGLCWGGQGTRSDDLLQSMCV